MTRSISKDLCSLDATLTDAEISAMDDTEFMQTAYMECEAQELEEGDCPMPEFSDLEF